MGYNRFANWQRVNPAPATVEVTGAAQGTLTVVPGQASTADLSLTPVPGQPAGTYGGPSLTPVATVNQAGQVLEVDQVVGAGGQGGFGFFAGGTMSSGEALGTVAWGTPRLFSGSSKDTADALFGPSGTAVLGLYSYVGNARFLAGTITFPPGSLTGTVAWANPTSVPAGVAMEVQAPIPADPTLASVRAAVYSS